MSNFVKPTVYLTSHSARQVTNSLKIFTWSSETVSHRRIPNTMTKSNAGHTMIYKRLRIEQHEPQSGGELICFGRVGSSRSTHFIRHCTLIIYPALSHEKDQIVITTNGTYRWLSVIQIAGSG